MRHQRSQVAYCDHSIVSAHHIIVTTRNYFNSILICQPLNHRHISQVLINNKEVRIINSTIINSNVNCNDDSLVGRHHSQHTTLHLNVKWPIKENVLALYLEILCVSACVVFHQSLSQTIKESLKLLKCLMLRQDQSSAGVKNLE